MENEIKSVEDLPFYIPIIFIYDKSRKFRKSRIFGNDCHDRLVIEDGGHHLFYYNCGCGESSHKCSDFEFVREEPSCLEDDFYSRWCQMVDIKELIKEHDKQILAEERKNLVKEIRQDLANKLTYNINDLENIMVICNKINSVLDKFERGE